MKTTREQRDRMREFNKVNRQRLPSLKDFADALCDDLDTQESELTKLRKRVEVLTDALTFYSKGGNFNFDLWQHETLGHFTGKRAKEALAESAKIAGEK